MGLVSLPSVAGRTARPGNAVYGATKWGIDGWPESLRQELQPGVRVMVIEPGAVATELTHASPTPRSSKGPRRCTSRLRPLEGAIVNQRLPGVLF